MSLSNSGADLGSTLFFDRSVGTTIPRTLRRLQVPVGIEWHQQHFDSDATDDLWLPQVGANGWGVLGFDWSYHLNQSELAAIRQYGIGVFYLWGADARTWERMFCFARAYDRIVNAMNSESRPFIFRVRRSGSLVKEL